MNLFDIINIQEKKENLNSVNQGFITQIDDDKLFFNKAFSYLSDLNLKSLNNFSIDKIYKTKFFFINFEKIYPFFVLKLFQKKKDLDFFIICYLVVTIFIKKKDF